MVGGASKFLMLLSAPSSSSSSASSANLRLLSPLVSSSSCCHCYSSSPFAIRLSRLPRRLGSFSLRPFALFSPAPSSFFSSSSILSPSSSSASSSFSFAAWAASSEGFHSQPVVKDQLGGEKPGSWSPPWPEWEKLLDGLRARGYFDRSFGRQLEEDKEDVLSKLEQLPGDFVAAARACLSFARDYADALRSLSKNDIGIVVESVSPLLFENIVNSTGRIRAFLDDDVLQHEKAHTVDVMRLLLSCICDSIIASGQNGLQKRELVEGSVRKLLGELVELCGFVDYRRHDSMPRQFLSTSGQSLSSLGQNIVMKRGDWTCPKCQFMNFARNARCRQCAEARPKRQLTGGEWECPQCDFYNYGRNAVCLRCDCKRPVDSLFGTAPTSDPDRLAENDEKAQRWFSKVSQLNDSSDLSSAIADDDFPEIMPLRKGVNRFVVSTRKTPLERRLANAQYRRNLGNDGPAEESGSQNDRSVGKILDEIIGPSLPSSSSSSLPPPPPPSQQSRNRLSNSVNNSGYVPFTPLDPGMFARPKNATPEAELEVADLNKTGSPVNGIGDVSAGGNTGAIDLSNASIRPGKLMPEKVESELSDPSDRWFKKVAELHDVTDLASAIPDDEFPEIMPLRKGENRFVISKKKDRSLTSPQYKRRLAMEQANNSNFVPFVPFPPDYFAKKDKNATEASNISASDLSNGNSSISSVSVNVDKVTQKDSWSNVPENLSREAMATSLEGSSMKESKPLSRGQGQQVGGAERKQAESSDGNARENWSKGLFTGKSLEGSAVKEPDPLDMSEEAKAERWFKRVAQIKDISELSQIPDEDFPEIMPMRKGVNRFVVSKRKTPLERRLTSPQYRRNLPVVSSDPDKGTS